MTNTTHVTIRPITECDTKNIVSWRNQPDVQNNFLWRETLTEQAHLNWLHCKVFTGKVAQFIIEIENPPLAVGSVYLQNIDKNSSSAEFGIFIGEKSARGKGIGKLATLQILKYAFDTLHLNTVYLRVLESNHSAIHSYESAGFSITSAPIGEATVVNNENVIFMEIKRPAEEI